MSPDSQHIPSQFATIANFKTNNVNNLETFINHNILDFDILVKILYVQYFINKLYILIIYIL